MASSARKVIDNIVEFIEVKTEQIKLRVMAHVARMLSGVIALSVTAMLMFFFLFFLSFGLSEIINASLESTYYGYLIVAGGYFVIIVLVIILLKTKKLQRWIEALIVNIEEARHEQEREH